MFNFLVFIGFSLIIWGVYTDRDNLDISLLKIPSKVGADKVEELISRVEGIEDILYSYNPIVVDDDDDDEIIFKEVLDATTIQEDKSTIAVNTTEAFNVISLYEAGKYTLEQTCKILNMNKGEVLLLKNIYKKYQN